MDWALRSELDLFQTHSEVRNKEAEDQFHDVERQGNRRQKRTLVEKQKPFILSSILPWVSWGVDLTDSYFPGLKKDVRISRNLRALATEFLGQDHRHSQCQLFKGL